MQQAVAPCLEITMSIKGKPTRSLLDSGSEVTLINESYYKENIEHRVYRHQVRITTRITYSAYEA